MTVPSRAPQRATSRSSSQPTLSLSSQWAVLIDGSALYLAARTLFEGRQLNYRALVDLLCREIHGLQPPRAITAPHPWVMWTSAAAQNQGQNRFLDFAESDLHWEVRRVSPADSFMVEPTTVLGLSTEGRAASRLVRFDASIAFAIGRLAPTHQVVLLTDSFSVADPLMRAAQIHGDQTRPVLVFFGRALDARWQRVLRTEKDLAPRLIDLDDYETDLFGSESAPDRPPVRKSTFVF